MAQKFRSRLEIHERIRGERQPDPDPFEANELEILRSELLREIYREIENLPDKCGQIF
jgi:hypothetical protein